MVCEREYFFADSTTRVEGFICQVRRGKATFFFVFFTPPPAPCQAFTTFRGVPARNARTFATVVSIKRARAAFAAHA